MDKKLYKFGMDWLNGVLPVSDVMSVFEMLEKFSSKLRFDRWTLLNSGRYNYARRYALDGKMTIQLMYNPVSDEEGFTADMNHNNSGIFFSISGDGIRYLHSLGGDVSALNKLLFFFYRYGFKSSRFDVYCDILDDKNEIVPLIQDAFDNFQFPDYNRPTLRTNVQRKRGNVTLNSYYDDNGKKFINCTLGHHGTRFGMFRCYNKFVEVSDGRLSEISSEVFKSYDVEDYWYRLEYEMHKENASACFDALMSRAEADNSPLCFEDIFYSVFERVFTVVDYKTPSGLSHQPISDVWSAFGSELQENNIHLVQFNSVPYIKCTLSRLGKNAERICGYYYAIGQYLGTLSSEERRQFLKLAKDKYENQPKYNLLRDEIDDFHTANTMLRSEVLDTLWSQVEIDFPEFA